MSVAFRTIVLTLAWFACMNAISSAAVAWLVHAFRHRRPRSRPSVLLGIRLVPSVVSLLFVGALFLPAQWAWEPRDADETLGFALRGVAALGAAVLLRGVWRVVVTAWATHRVNAGIPSYRRAAPNTYLVDGLSGVSLAGIVRPRILIGRDVKAQLSCAELEVAVAHEVAHRDAFDNLARWCMRCAPDFLTGSRVAARLEHAWHVAAESRADARAIRGNRARAVDLASALIKVARLSAATTGQVSVPSWSTLNDCELLEWRVQRLLNGSVPPIPSLPRVGLVVATLVLSVLIVVPIVAGPVHRLTETLIALLP